MDWVHPGQGGGDDGMPHLVIGHDLALVRIEQSAAVLDAGYDAFDCTSEVVCADGVSAAPRCPQRGFVDQIGQVGARKARRQRRDQAAHPGIQPSINRPCCSADLGCTKRIVGRRTASQIASASAASFLLRLT